MLLVVAALLDVSHGIYCLKAGNAYLPDDGALSTAGFDGDKAGALRVQHHKQALPCHQAVGSLTDVGDASLDTPRCPIDLRKHTLHTNYACGPPS